MGEVITGGIQNKQTKRPMKIGWMFNVRKGMGGESSKAEGCLRSEHVRYLYESVKE